MESYTLEVLLCESPKSLTPKYFYREVTTRQTAPKSKSFGPLHETIVTLEQPFKKCVLHMKTKREIQADESDDTKKRKIVTQKENSEQFVPQIESEYEAMVRKKREERLAFLATLNIDEAKQDFVRAVGVIIGSSPKNARVKRVPKQDKIVHSYSLRKSMRLQKRDPSTSSPNVPSNRYPVKPHGPLPFTDVLYDEDKTVLDKFAKSLSTLPEIKSEIKSEPITSESYKSWFDSMKSDSSLVVKVLLSKVYSLAVHPALSRTLICAGGAAGEIGILDIQENCQHGNYLFEPHSDRVTCLAYNPDNHSEFYSSSYDGTLRCGDLEKAVFDEVHRSPENGKSGCSSFDFLSPSTFIVSHKEGTISIADKRAHNFRNASKPHQIHTGMLKTVSVHPVKKTYFIASGSSGIVSLWDIRQLTKGSVTDIPHKKSLNSGYFSPLTGNSILTTSMDDRLSVFNSTMLTENISLEQTINHNNFTGRWLTPFRAVYLPNNDDFFVVGSMLQPRCIEIYSISGKLVHSFRDENVNSVCSINAFHPARPILVGGNSSGKLHVFLNLK